MAAHHLQQADEHHETALNSRVRTHASYPWGVLEFKLSDPERVNLRFKIERLEAVMDDGLIISIPEYDPPPDGVSVGQLFATPDRIVDVYLAVPEVGEDQNFLLDGNSSAHGQKQMLRYGSVPIPGADQTTGKNSQWIDFARKNIRLLLGDELRTGYSTILIARIRKTAEGFEPVREHVPPLLNVKASPWLEGELTKLTAKLLDKNRPVGDDQRQVDGGASPSARVMTSRAHGCSTQSTSRTRSRGAPARSKCSAPVLCTAATMVLASVEP
jgi:predicted component of type VI protein secretion system